MCSLAEAGLKLTGSYYLPINAAVSAASISSVSPLDVSSGWTEMLCLVCLETYLLPGRGASFPSETFWWELLAEEMLKAKVLTWLFLRSVETASGSSIM